MDMDIDIDTSTMDYFFLIKWLSDQFDLKIEDWFEGLFGHGDNLYILPIEMLPVGTSLYALVLGMDRSRYFPWSNQVLQLNPRLEGLGLMCGGEYLRGNILTYILLTVVNQM